MATECRVQLSADAVARGKVITPGVSGASPVREFHGLPYAQPPVADLRFRPPQPLPLWTGERDCTDFSVMCPQPRELSQMVHDMMGTVMPERMSEDCLYLSVFTPTSVKRPLPVMLWIHGGAFCLGTGFSSNGSVLSGLHNVVVVTINYRLGAFGFLSSGDDVIAGNFGLLDQIEAMKWVQKHIAVFGGDPDNVTIFGESAGGMSCSLHVVSDLAAGLFKRAIIQSGAATSPYVTVTQQRARKLIQPQLDAAGYKGKTSADLDDFLRGKTAEELGDMGAAMLSFKAVIDGHYLKDYPANLYAAGRFNEVDIITGCTSHEGAGVLKMLLPEPEFCTIEESLRKYVRTVVDWLYFSNQQGVCDALYAGYIPPEAVGNPEVFKQQFTDLYGDMYFVGPNYNVALKHSEKAAVYVYSYAHRRSTSTEVSWIGANHGDDINPTFGDSLLGSTFSDEDKKVSKHMMMYWTNFAKTGDPNGSELTKWPQFTKDQKPYLLLKTESEAATDYLHGKTEFWEKEMPQVINKIVSAPEANAAPTQHPVFSTQDLAAAFKDRL